MILFSIESPDLYYTGDRALKIEKGLKVKAGVTALVGDNGSGKTTFTKILEKGRNYRTNKILNPSGKKLFVKTLEFNDIHSLPGVSVEYYQQRYEEAMNEETPEVSRVFPNLSETPEFEKLCKVFGLEGVKEKKINALSSGELRKMLIINALHDAPDLLILDNPYIGLDAKSRKLLNESLLKLKKEGKSVMFVLTDLEEAPDFTDHVIFASNQKIGNQKIESTKGECKSFDFKDKEKVSYGDKVFELKDCTVRYGNKTILENLSWTVKPGERWSLSGPNGSGKSTLLSLLNADNPKAYCNNFFIFGRKRGSGESIWDIKKKIGYVSPEMQLHFHGSGTVSHILANGLNDTVGLYVKPTEEQKEEALKWLEHFNLLHLKDRLYNTLSSGERQMILVARSLIKQPELLILDEPMHALDHRNRKLVMQTISDFLSSNPQSAFIMVTHLPEELPPDIDHKMELGS